MAWSPFSYDSFDVDSLPSLSEDGDFDEGIVTSEELAGDDSNEDLFRSYQLTKESVFEEADKLFGDEDEVEEHCGECDDDVEECGDYEEDEPSSPFKEMCMFEAVLDDGEDDTIAEDIEDMPDDDDEAIDADAEGIEEIEADIIDDEEDDLIDMAMDADEE